MTPGPLVALFALALTFVVSGAPWSDATAEAQRPAVSRSGVLGGADYLIEVPANWNGGLVVFAHGIQRGPGRGDVRMPPIASHIIGEGHAWIASGYRAREYQPHLFIEDLVALRELFLKEIGPPRWSIIYGQSMGGHITVASLELRPGLYQGGLVGMRARRRHRDRRLPDGVHRRGRADLRRAHRSMRPTGDAFGPLLASASCRRSACRARTPRAGGSSTAS